MRIVCVLIVAAALACASAPPEETIVDGHKIVAPSVVKRVEPEYPNALKQAGVSGTVWIGGIIPKEGGALRDAKVISSEDPRLNQLALDAVSKWIWKPGTADGQPVDAEFRTAVSFNLRQ